MGWLTRLSWRPRRGTGVLVTALGLVGVGLAGVGMLSVTVHAAQPENDALAMFGEMMPVFSSPRCANCHGGVNPVSGENHEPGPVPDSTRLSNGDMGFDEQKVCQECHTAGTAQWRLAPRDFSFVGKDNLVLCRQIRRTMGLADAGSDGGNFVNHIATDDLIGVGFVGQGGIGNDSPFAPIAPEPPPMTRPEMVAAAKHWVVDGQAKCGANGWNGVITSTETGQQHVVQQGGTVVLDNATTLKTTIVVVDSTATATVFYEAHDFRDAGPGHGCTIHHDSWKADGRADAELKVIGDTDEGGMYVAWAVPQLTGVHHAENGTIPPNCKPVVTDEPYSVRQGHGGVSTFGFAAGTTYDPNGPKSNHVTGQNVTQNPNVNTTTTIQWDLSRDP